MGTDKVANSRVFQAEADVAVIGVPDKKRGEAAINGTRLEKLAGYKVPKSVEFIDQIPRSMIGKALKAKLRAPYWEGRDSVI